MLTKLRMAPPSEAALEAAFQAADANGDNQISSNPSPSPNPNLNPNPNPNPNPNQATTRYPSLSSSTSSRPHPTPSSSTKSGARAARGWEARRLWLRTQDRPLRGVLRLLAENCQESRHRR